MSDSSALNRPKEHRLKERKKTKEKFRKAWKKEAEEKKAAYELFEKVY